MCPVSATSCTCTNDSADDNFKVQFALRAKVRCKNVNGFWHRFQAMFEQVDQTGTHINIIRFIKSSFLSSVWVQQCQDLDPLVFAFLPLA